MQTSGVSTSKSQRDGLNKEEAVVIYDVHWKTKSRTATRSEGGEENEVLGARSREVVIWVSEIKIIMVSMDMRAEKVKEGKIENAKELGTGSSEELERKVKKKDIVDTIFAGSGAAEQESGPKVEKLKSTMKKDCLFRDTLLDDPKDEYGLETSFFLTGNMNRVLADPPSKTRSARYQSKSSSHVFSKCDMEDVVRLMDSKMAPGAHGRILCSGLLFYSWNRSLLATNKKANDVQGVSEYKKKRVSEVVAAEDQALLYVKRPVVYIYDRRRKDLFRSSVSEVGIHLCRRVTTRDTMLQVADYSASRDNACQHPGWKNEMTNILQVPQKKPL